MFNIFKKKKRRRRKKEEEDDDDEEEKEKKSKKGKSDDKRPIFDIHTDTMKSVWGIVFLTLFIISILGLFEMAGRGGEFFVSISEMIFGIGKYSIPLVFIVASFILFTTRARNAYFPLIVGGALFFSGILGMLEVSSPEGDMRGGYWGFAVAWPLLKSVGNIASFVILIGFIFASIVISFNVRVSNLIEYIQRIMKTESKDEDEEADEKDEESKEEDKKEGDGIKVKTWNEESSDEADEKNFGKLAGALKRAVNEGDKKDPNAEGDFRVRSSAFKDDDFRLPPTELLEKETGKPSSGDIVANANIIKRTLQNFGIDVEMGEVSVGPTVTQFTLKPAEGVKLARIIALHNDLSLALAAHPIRIEAPVPGRSLVGIEIPNKGISIVRLKNLLETPGRKKFVGNLVLCLGRDVAGEGVYADLTKMPHLMIAGSTGSGKSIALNAIILSLLYQATPSRLRMILIDPKRVEFPVYSDIPHLKAPVVVDPQKAVNALKWAVHEMERRFEFLASAKARDIVSYNSNKKNIEEHGPLPYIVIVIDELASLMTVRGKEVEALIVRLAQMARAVGIHLILATQRPSVEVITGLIKANVTSRMAFQVASQVDSRTVLDMSGAEKLLGNGDMLFVSGDASKPKRVQGAFVSDKEIRAVADFVREEGNKMAKNEEEDDAESFERIQEGQGLPLKPKEGGLNGGFSPVESYVSSEGASFVDFDDAAESNQLDDDRYEDAKREVIRAQKASVSFLQRRLSVGYARAARLVDLLEENGIVGAGAGSKPREVYVPREELEKKEGEWTSV